MIYWRRVRFALLALLVVAPSSFGQDKQEKSLRDQIESVVQSFKQKNAKLAVHIFSVKQNQTVFAANERESMMLASNTKLLTCSAALCRLGREFKFRTSVGMAGNDLHAFAGGDPNLSGRFHDDDPTAIFKGWAAKLKAAGVAKVENLVLHGAIFDDVHLHPGWKIYEPWHWWNAPFGAFSLNDNCVDLKVEPAAEGEPAKVTIAPDTAHVKIVNQTRSAVKARSTWGFSSD